MGRIGFQGRGDRIAIRVAQLQITGEGQPLHRVERGLSRRRLFVVHKFNGDGAVRRRAVFIGHRVDEAIGALHAHVGRVGKRAVRVHRGAPLLAVGFQRIGQLRVLVLVRAVQRAGNGFANGAGVAAIPRGGRGVVGAFHHGEHRGGHQPVLHPVGAGAIDDKAQTFAGLQRDPGQGGEGKGRDLLGQQLVILIRGIQPGGARRVIGVHVGVLPHLVDGEPHLEGAGRGHVLPVSILRAAGEILGVHHPDIGLGGVGEDLIGAVLGRDKRQAQCADALARVGDEIRDAALYADLPRGLQPILAKHVLVDPGSPAVRLHVFEGVKAVPVGVGVVILGAPGEILQQGFLGRVFAVRPTVRLAAEQLIDVSGHAQRVLAAGRLFQRRPAQARRGGEKQGRGRGQRQGLALETKHAITSSYYHE